MKNFVSLFCAFLLLFTQTASASLTTLGVGAFPYEVLPTMVYNGRKDADNTSTTLSVTGLSIGAADASRVVVVAVSCGRNSLPASLSSATISGGAAAIAVNRNGTGSNAPRSSTTIIYRAVPSGTTTSVVIYATGNDFQHCLFASYSLYNLNSNSPVDTCSSVNSCTLSTASDGFAFANGAAYDGSCSAIGGGFTANYSGVNLSSGCSSGGSRATTGANVTPSLSMSGSVSEGMTAASWR